MDHNEEVYRLWIKSTLSSSPAEWPGPPYLSNADGIKKDVLRAGVTTVMGCDNHWLYKLIKFIRNWK